MPTIAEDILMLLAEGAFRFLTFRSLFTLNWGSNYPAYLKTITRLEKDGAVRRVQHRRGVYLHLTDRGRKILEQRRPPPRKSPPTWDRLWRLVIFDIPEKRNEDRLLLRRYLTASGFAKVQKSVWIAPYDREEQVQEFTRKIDIQRYVLQLTVKKFRNLEERDLAAAFWDIQGLQVRYQELIQRYAKRMAVLPARTRGAELGRRQFLNDLIWDYQTILALDPQLPTELLPANWSGAAAKQFVNRCRTLLSSGPA